MIDGTARSVSAVASLREATRNNHDEVDALFSSLPLGRMDSYRRFLRAQARAHLAVESALDAAGAGDIITDWAERRRGDALIADLSDLREPVPSRLAAPAFGDRAAVLGGVYVLEGSRLGGKLLARMVPAEAPTRFIAAPARAGSWRELLAMLDRMLRPDDLGAAVNSAREVFDRFADAGRQELEPIAS